MITKSKLINILSDTDIPDDAEIYVDQSILDNLNSENEKTVKLTLDRFSKIIVAQHDDENTILTSSLIAKSQTENILIVF